MKFSLLALFLLSFPAWGVQFCPEIIEVKSEQGKKLVFCQLDDLMVSWDCHQQKADCSWVKLLEKRKSEIKNPMKSAQTRNPGSWICEQLGLKVIMAKAKDNSDLCTCLNKSGDSATCSSLIEAIK